MEDDKSMVEEVECVRNPSRRRMLSYMMAGILVCVVVVVLIEVVGVVCDIFELGVSFVVVVVEVELKNLELVGGCVMRLVLWFWNGRGGFLVMFEFDVS